MDPCFRFTRASSIGVCLSPLLQAARSRDLGVSQGALKPQGAFRHAPPRWRSVFRTLVKQNVRLAAGSSLSLQVACRQVIVSSRWQATAMHQLPTCLFKKEPVHRNSNRLHPKNWGQPQIAGNYSVGGYPDSVSQPSSFSPVCQIP